MATTTATPKLPELARRIAQQEAALAALRHKLDARLTDLNRRREKLRAELRTVEAEIDGVSQGGPEIQRGTPERAASSLVPPAKARAVTHAKRRAGSGPSLAEFLVRLVREGKGKPLALTELQEQTLRRGFPSSSTNLPRMVKKRAYELVERGLLGRDRSTGGFVLTQGRNSSRAATASPPAGPKTSAAAKPSAVPKVRAEKVASPIKSRSAPVAGARTGQPSLRAVLLNILEKDGRTLSAQELADRARKAGYRTQSKNFKDVIWVAVRNMPQVEHDPRGGYRLRNR